MCYRPNIFDSPSCGGGGGWIGGDFSLETPTNGKNGDTNSGGGGGGGGGTDDSGVYSGTNGGNGGSGVIILFF